MCPMTDILVMPSDVTVFFICSPPFLDPFYITDKSLTEVWWPFLHNVIYTIMLLYGHNYLIMQELLMEI